MSDNKKETEGKTLCDAAEIVAALGGSLPMAIRPMPEVQMWEPIKPKFTKRLRNISRWRQ